MSRICYIPKRFSLTARLVIARANEICAEFGRDGDDLTLRQFYYQFVAHDHFPDDRTWVQVGNRWVPDPNGTKNAEPNYKWLGGLVNDARLAGELDWRYIVDRTRAVYGGSGSDTDPSEVVASAAEMYAIDKWEGQEFYVEAWVEKDALSGVLQRACGPLEIPYFACRGYPSQSAIWRAAQRLRFAFQDDKRVRIIHLGDHDPSGIDMTRDIEERLSTFLAQDHLGMEDGRPVDEYVEAMADDGLFEVRRIALTMAQIREFDPPPNPAKLTDSRGSSYVREYGDSSWELDALSPAVLRTLITETVLEYRDDVAWRERVSREVQEKRILVALNEHWSEVAGYVRLNWPDEVEGDDKESQ
jgi:hypothetical protein